MPDLDAPAEDSSRRGIAKLPLLMLTRNLWLIAAAIGLVMFIGSVAFDLMLLKHQETPVAILLSNGLVAFLAALLVFILLTYGRERRRLIVHRVETLDEVNHHIRNALQSLTFTAGALKGTKDGANITEAIERIQWALHEVLPQVEPSYEPFQGSAREASQQRAVREDNEAR